MNLRVLLFEDSGSWIAQCLELDICAQGVSKEQAVENLRGTIDLHEHLDLRAKNAPFHDVLREPPSDLVKVFDRGTPWEPPAPKREKKVAMPFRVHATTVEQRASLA